MSNTLEKIISDKKGNIENYKKILQLKTLQKK